jgi:hypothetical protein
MPISLIRRAYFASWSRVIAPSSSGELPRIAKPKSSSLRRTSASPSTFRMATHRRSVKDRTAWTNSAEAILAAAGLETAALRCRQIGIPRGLCLTIGPSQRSCKSQENNDHGEAEQYCIKRHAIHSHHLGTNLASPVAADVDGDQKVGRILRPAEPNQAAANASARDGSRSNTPPGMMSSTPSRSSLVNVRLTVSMVRPR